MVPVFLKVIVLRDEAAAQSLWSILRQNWRAMASAGTPLEVIVCPWRRQRTQAQNRKYWAVLNEIAEHAWVDGKQYAAEVWHEEFKRRFIGMADLPFGGAAGISTTGLSASEFAEYLTRIQAFAAMDLGVQVE